VKKVASWLFLASALACVAAPSPKRIAAIVTEYRYNSHADVIVGRLVQGFMLNDQGARPNLKLVSLYTDQVPANDTSRALMKKHGIPIYKTIAETLTLGGKELAVDGVLLVAEHGKYPRNSTGNVIWPKRRMFEAVAEVFRKSGRAVPVFCDKHLADNWKDAKWLLDTARQLKTPLMAGSSLPVLWRYPPVDVARGAKLKEMVAVSYHTLDAYGFHALEMVQCLAERRAGGETGVKQVRLISGDAVWQANFDRALLKAALLRLKRSAYKPGMDLKKMVKNPTLIVIDYRDGFRANVFTLNGAVVEWAVAWREGGQEKSTTFWTQEARPYMHFTYQVKGLEEMFHTGQATWPAERTLVTSAVLDAALISKSRKGAVVPTPYLNLSYQNDWNWKQPPPPPPDGAIP